MQADTSILNNIRELLVGDSNDTSFDLDLIFAINTALNNLTDVGVGPESGFTINGSSETWEDFLGEDYNKNLERIKTYVQLETKILFDPPSSSYVLEALQKKSDEALVRANWQVDDQSGRGGNKNG